MTELEYITDLELRLAALQARLESQDKQKPLQKAHELFCRHALRITGAGALVAFALAWLLGREGFQPLLAALNAAGALLVLRLAFCKELPELKCEACNRDIARPLLFALAVLFSLFAAGHMTGLSLLMTLAITLEHAALFVVAIDPRIVASAVKKFSQRVNLDPAKYAGHSLRSGGATAMAQKGVDLGLIVNHGRWQNPQTVSRHYIRPANALGKANPMRRVL